MHFVVALFIMGELLGIALSKTSSNIVFDAVAIPQSV